MNGTHARENLLAMVARKKTEFATLPLFEFMRSEQVSDTDKICWIPAFAPLAMIFGDIWESVIRQEPTDDPVQALVNRHTHEDAPHRYWYPIDIESQNLGESMGFSDSVRFIWGKSNRGTRVGTLRIVQAATGAPPIALLAMVEAIEATVQVCIPITCEVTNRIEAKTGKRHPYWGAAHFSIDGNHSTADDLDAVLANHPYTDEEYARAHAAIEIAFAAFIDCFNEMYAFAQEEMAREQRIFGHGLTRTRPRFEQELSLA